MNISGYEQQKGGTGPVKRTANGAAPREEKRLAGECPMRLVFENGRFRVESKGCGAKFGFEMGEDQRGRQPGMMRGFCNMTRFFSGNEGLESSNRGDCGRLSFKN